MNKHFATGNVGQNPEIITTEKTTIANFSIACNYARKNKETGETIKETDWIRCVAFGRRAETIRDHVKAGMKLGIVGRVVTEKYQTETGENRYITKTIIDEFEFLSSAKNNTQGPPDGQRNASDDDDLPFN